MRRRAATGLGVLLATSSVAGAMAISGELAEARRAERLAYASALSEREAEAAAAGADRPRAAARVQTRTLCLRGAETVVARVARFLDSRPIDDGGRLDLTALARLSRRAAEVDRSAELPQRMGRRRGQPPGPGEAVAWEPIDPPDRICVELVDPAPGASPHGSRRALGAK